MLAKDYATPVLSILIGYSKIFKIIWSSTLDPFSNPLVFNRLCLPSCVQGPGFKSQAQHARPLADIYAVIVQGAKINKKSQGFGTYLKTKLLKRAQYLDTGSLKNIFEILFLLIFSEM